MRNIIDTAIILLAFVAGAAFVLVSDSPLSAQTDAPDLTRSELVQLIANVDSDGLNLRGVNLSGVDLSSLEFREANLSYANLSGANLEFTRLSYANFEGANLSGARLDHARATGAIFRDTNLGGVQGSDAAFWLVDFSGADFTNARFWSTDFCRISLANNTFVSVEFAGSVFDRVDLPFDIINNNIVRDVTLPNWSMTSDLGFFLNFLVRARVDPELHPDSDCLY